ncbi:MAG: hypothetical protein D6784_06475 [Chloroflexi bacterium]|nr:MAG: hypothetical protein D6784_06475 [Chloroflexota bacterium]
MAIQPGKSGPKLKIILSDLHLGAGFPGEQGNRHENFTADEMLVDLLEQISRESRRGHQEVELILNGDTFAFLQTPAVDQFDPAASYPPEAYHDSSEEASVKRLNLIIRGHPLVFDALADFLHVEQPTRRVTIVKGNHDIPLYWPRVKTRLREMLGATGVRASLLLFAEEFISREKIHVEHGHQRAEKMHAYHDFLDPRHPHAPTQLYHPAGSLFFINCINRLKPDYPFIDTIKPLTALVWYALHADFNLAAELLLNFIQHTPALVLHNYLPGTPLPSFASDLLVALQNPDRRRQMAEQYRHDPAFRLSLHRQIQQYLADAAIANRAETITAPAEVSDDPLVMAQAEQHQQQDALLSAAKSISTDEKIELVFFGHSHQPACHHLPGGKQYINTGSWIWNCNLNEANCIALSGQTIPAPKHLPYARLDYDEQGHPTAKLIDFATGQALDTSPQQGDLSILGHLQKWLRQRMGNSR